MKSDNDVYVLEYSFEQKITHIDPLERTAQMNLDCVIDTLKTGKKFTNYWIPIYYGTHTDCVIRGIEFIKKI